MIYYIYHVIGKKIGCTKNFKKRIAEQGFIEYEILEEHDDIEVASRREIELQIQYFGKRDSNMSYSQALALRAKALKARNKIPFSAEHRDKICRSNHSLKSVEHREKIAKALRGKIVSEETKKKLSLARKKPKTQKYLDEMQRRRELRESEKIKKRMIRLHKSSQKTSLPR